MDEKYKEFLEKKAEKYDKKNVTHTVKTAKNITFLCVSAFSDGRIAAIHAETYDDTALQNKFRVLPVDSLELVLKDTKKRQKRTYEKIGLTKEIMENGICDEEFCRKVSDYFIEYDGLIVGYGAKTSITQLNKLIQSSQMKCIENQYYDLMYMLKVCQEADYPDTGDTKNTKEAFKVCVHAYEKMEQLELNKRGCSLNYAYYWENEHNRAVKWIICNTSLANIYYDTLRKKWGITKKEQKKANNMRIEAIDTDDIESQLFRKYHVNNLEELQKKLAQRWKTKTDRKASAC